MQDNKIPIVVICGATASGKSSLALSIVKEIDSVIINADSMQVYSEIPVVTAQPSVGELQSYPHELYGVMSVNEACSVAQWIAMVLPIIDRCRNAGKVPILVGGTGMYISGLMDGLSVIPEIPDSVRKETQELLHMNGNQFIHDKLAELDSISAEKLNVNDTQRIIRAYEVVCHTGKPISYWHNQKRSFYDKKEFLTFCVDIDRKKLYKQCEKRFDMMLDNGAIEEVERLNYAKINPELPAMKALGVPEILKLIRGEWELDMVVENAKRSTRRYAKRQMTWFRNQLKGSVCITPTDKDVIIKAIKKYS